MTGFKGWNGRARDGRIEDLEVLVRFNLALAEESEALTLDPARLEAGIRALLLDESRGRYFVAESSAGEVLGCTMVTTEWSDWRNGQFWWLQSVYVRADARRLGVFKRLFEHVVSEARSSAGVIGLRLYVHAENRRAQSTYLRLGMSPTAYRVYEQVFGETGSAVDHS